MVIASTPTQLPLATFAKIIGIHPMHFAGVEYVPAGRTPVVCEAVYPQYDWQDADRVSREQIAAAIADAERLIESYLGYHLTPQWEVDEWREVPRPFRRENVNYHGLDATNRRSSVRAQWGHFIAGGVEEKTLVEAGSPIVWAADKFTGTVTVNVPAGTDECEIEAYYPSHDGDDAYQIRPLTVSIAANVATITIRREQVVSEALLETFDMRPATFATDGDFLDEVDVYTRSNDPSDQGDALWEPGSGCLTCNGVGCPSCAFAATKVCLYSRGEPILSIVAWQPAVWDAATETFTPTTLYAGRNPDVLRLRYYSGWRASRGCSRVMDARWARAVAYLALSLIDLPPCDCSSTVWQHWRDDYAKLSWNSGSNSMSRAQLRDINNPFGTQRGAIYAWRRVMDEGNAIPGFAALV